LGVVKFHEVGLPDWTGIRLRFPASIEVVGDILGVPLVFGFLFVSGIANDDGAKRDEVFGQFQDGGNIFAAFPVGVGASPYGAESQGICGQQDVFGGGGTVLNPKLPGRAVKGLLHVAANHDGEGRSCRHTRIRAGFGKLFQLCLVGDYHEVPRLFVHRRGSRHSSAQQLLNLDGIHRFAEVFAHGGAGRDVLQRRILVIV